VKDISFEILGLIFLDLKMIKWFTSGSIETEKGVIKVPIGRCTCFYYNTTTTIN